MREGWNTPGMSLLFEELIVGLGGLDDSRRGTTRDSLARESKRDNPKLSGDLPRWNFRLGDFHWFSPEMRVGALGPHR